MQVGMIRVVELIWHKPPVELLKINFDKFQLKKTISIKSVLNKRLTIEETSFLI